MTDLFFFNELKKKPIVSNYYSVDSELFDNNGRCNFEFRKQDGLICIFKESESFFKQMFFFLSKEKLNEKMYFFNNEDYIVSEIVFSELHKSQDDLISNWFLINENFHYKTFMRMFKVSKHENNDADFSRVVTPSHEDIYEIHKKIHDNFDVLSERIPTVQELFALMNSTYIIKENDEIASVLISEIKGKTEELRYWLVLPKYRNLGYGNLLMKYFLNLNKETIRYTLWVDVTNLNAIRKYEINGFIRDKLINKIFINNRIMKNKIVEILKETRPEFEFEENINFIDAGYLDSFDLITIVADLENTFEVKINGALMVPENFQNIDSIMNLVQASKNAS